MKNIVGIRFKRAGKIYYFDPAQNELSTGDFAIVETAQGLEYGEIVTGPKEVDEKDLISPLKPVIRKATANDIEKVAENKDKEKEAIRICEQKIKNHKLDMNLVDVEYAFDVSKIVFYFTAEGRIDFRELVKDLAAVFRTRIELRQIGVRDEAKMMNGIGCCGRTLCCATFLGDFEPVSIRMAKDQHLSLNPTKISGICGRLMCCLKYENDLYCMQQEQRKNISAPAIGCEVITAEGEGRVVTINQKNRTARIQLDENTIDISWNDIVEKEKHKEIEQ